MPDMNFEVALARTAGRGPVCGVDEVGRGPWAGPVVACAVILPEEGLPADVVARLDDSKRLTARNREILFEPLCSLACYALGEASVTEIDTLNILEATMLAMRRAIAGLSIKPAAVLVDGNRDPKCGLVTQLLVKGDCLSLSCAAASIIAKVSRDRFMAKLSKRFPEYGWDKNAGYGTKAHKTGLVRAGISEWHRKSFNPVKTILARRE